MAVAGPFRMRYRFAVRYVGPAQLIKQFGHLKPGDVLHVQDGREFARLTAKPDWVDASKPWPPVKDASRAQEPPMVEPIKSPMNRKARIQAGKTA